MKMDECMVEIKDQEVPAPARKVTVRGLCELSIFDK